MVIRDGSGQETKTRLGELRDLGENYCLFRLKARAADGQRPRYPAARSAASENVSLDVGAATNRR